MNAELSWSGPRLSDLTQGTQSKLSRLWRKGDALLPCQCLLFQRLIPVLSGKQNLPGYLFQESLVLSSAEAVWKLFYNFCLWGIVPKKVHLANGLPLYHAFHPNNQANWQQYTTRFFEYWVFTQPRPKAAAREIRKTPPRVAKFRGFAQQAG